MSTVSELGFILTQKQKVTISYALEQDTDLWLVLLSEHLNSHGEKSEMLKAGLIDDTEGWKQLVAEVKQKGFRGLEILAIEKNTDWNLGIERLLSDAGHVNLLNLYLRSLASQKIKKVADIGSRAQLHKQINAIMAAVANDALTALDRYSEAKVSLASGKTPAGKEFSKILRLFYEENKTENLKQIASMIGVIILLKSARGPRDVKQLQVFIQAHLLNPLEQKTTELKQRLGSSTVQADYLAGEEIKQTLKTIGDRKVFYRKLLRAVEINFA